MMNGIGVAGGAAEALIDRETDLAAIIYTMQVEDVPVIDLEGDHIVGA